VSFTHSQSHSKAADGYRLTTHLENLEKSGNSKVVREKSGKIEKVREKSGEVKSAEIWLFAQLKYQYHKPHLLYFVSSWCHLVCHFAAVTTLTVK